MRSKKREFLPNMRRRIVRLEQQLVAVGARIARLEKNPHLGPAEQDPLFLWKRPVLFMTSPPETLQ
jgi:hypothetical protein